MAQKAEMQGKSSIKDKLGSITSLFTVIGALIALIVFFSLTRSLSNDKKGQSLFIISYLMQSVRCGSSKEEAPAR